MRLLPRRRTLVQRPGEQHDGGANDQPFNPANGHSWRCSCGTCAIFWDTWYGERIYELTCNYLRQMQPPKEN